MDILYCVALSLFEKVDNQKSQILLQKAVAKAFPRGALAIASAHLSGPTQELPLTGNKSSLPDAKFSAYSTHLTIQPTNEPSP